jgi:DNA-binding LacI/PurR family transcriptional regulator
MDRGSELGGVWASGVLPRDCGAEKASAIDNVYGYVRGLIDAADIAPGERIPATAELAEQWALPAATVHHAMQRLTQDGYVVRRRRLGTFVREPGTQLKTVGIYVPNHLLTGAGRFVSTVCGALQDACGKARLESMLLADPRNDEAQCEPWPELERLAALGQIDAVVTPAADHLIIPWFDRLSVPVAYITGARTRNSVRFDSYAFGKMAAEALTKAGSRRIGLVMGWSRHTYPSYGLTCMASRDLLNGLRSAARARGIDVSDDWIEGVEDRPGISEAQHAERGYAMTRHLLQAHPDLDGLVVYPDGMAQGAACAVLERGPDAPLPNLVFHRNREIPFFCPLPVMWLETTAHDVARLLLGKIRRGNDPAKRKEEMIGYRLVDGGGGSGDRRQGSGDRRQGSGDRGQETGGRSQVTLKPEPRNLKPKKGDGR